MFYKYRGQSEVDPGRPSSSGVPVGGMIQWALGYHIHPAGPRSFQPLPRGRTGADAATETLARRRLSPARGYGNR